jgi:hypothetical protein
MAAQQNHLKCANDQRGVEIARHDAERSGVEKLADLHG